MQQEEVVDKKSQDRKPNKEKKLMADLIELSFSISKHHFKKPRSTSSPSNRFYQDT